MNTQADTPSLSLESILHPSDFSQAEVGLLTYDQPSSPFLPGVAPAPPKASSKDTGRQIDTEVRAIVDRAHEQVRQILGENKDALERLARRLLDQEVLEGAELQDLLAPQPVTTVAAFSPREPHRES